jgi:hypothetical protein
MGWSIHYSAKSTKPDIQFFLAAAKSQSLALSKNCERYKWRAADDYSASGFTKVHYSAEPAKDFVTILQALQALVHQMPHVTVTVSDDYYLEEQDVIGVDVSKVFESDLQSGASAQPFKMDSYVTEYEIPSGLTVDIEELLPSCSDEKVRTRVRNAIGAWRRCGAEAVYTRRFIFHPDDPSRVDEELVFLKLPADKAKRERFASEISKLYGKEVEIPPNARLLTTQMLK